MNDTELDELLDVWKVPLPRETMRELLRAEIAVTPRPSRRKRITRWRLLAAAAVVVFALLVVNPDAFSKKDIGYTVDSEILYSPEWSGYGVIDGPVGEPERVLMTSYNQAGSEVVLSWSFPDHPMEAAFVKMKVAVDGLLERLASPFEELARYYYVYKYDLKTPRDEPLAGVYPGEPHRGLIVGRGGELLSSGCRTEHGGSEVLGQAVILNYATIAVQQYFRGPTRKMTLWMAPELGCFALRATVHAKTADGGWKLVSQKKALKVTVNR